MSQKRAPPWSGSLMRTPSALITLMSSCIAFSTVSNTRIRKCNYSSSPSSICSFSRSLPRHRISCRPPKSQPKTRTIPIRATVATSTGACSARTRPLPKTSFLSRSRSAPSIASVYQRFRRAQSGCVQNLPPKATNADDDDSQAASGALGQQQSKATVIPGEDLIGVLLDIGGGFSAHAVPPISSYAAQSQPVAGLKSLPDSQLNQFGVPGFRRSCWHILWSGHTFNGRHS